jgi:hypothetical protein
LNFFTKATPLSPTVTLQLSPNVPLVTMCVLRCVHSHRTPPPLQHVACRACLPRFGTELRMKV